MQKSTFAIEAATRFERAERTFVRTVCKRSFLCIVLALSLCVFLLICIEWRNENDFMYAVSAAAWDQNGKLYTDVPFIQAPFSIILILILTKLFGIADIFLFGRITSILFVLGAALVPPLFYRKPPTAWIIFIGAFLTNPYVHSNSREIGNYALPLLCLSVAITILEMRRFSPLSRGFIACAAIGLATSTKLYFAAMCPAILLFFIVTEKEARQKKNVAACLAGFVVGLSPILFFLMRDYQSFLKWNVYVHFDILKTKRSVDGLMASPTQVLHVTLHFISQMLIPLAFTGLRLIEEHRSPNGSYVAVGKLTLIASAYFMAAAPGFVYDEFLAPLAFLLVLFSVPSVSSSERLQSRYIIFFFVLFCTQTAIMIERGTSYWLNFSGKAFDVVEVIKIQNRAQKIVDLTYSCSGKLYTAEPVFLLNAKIQYPRELAAGPFLLFLQQDLRKLGDDFDVTNRIERWQPDIVIWGYYVNRDPTGDKVDRIVQSYAVRHNFKIVPLGSLDQSKIYLAYRRGCRA